MDNNPHANPGTAPQNDAQTAAQNDVQNNAAGTAVQTAAPENKVVLEIKRHGWLYELLRKPRELWKLFNFLFALLVVLFISLGLVVIMLKQFFPYNTITTGIYGNTTLRSEDRDVTYWLFNTAELWAKSGIKVKKGDILTIRASGASHTAVHHLAKSAEENTDLDLLWNDTGGSVLHSGTDWDKNRREFRVAPGENEGVLLMQVIPEDVDEARVRQLYFDGRNQESEGRIYVIGKERQNLVIQQDGILYFAVNDVVLTPGIIDMMFRNTVSRINGRLAPADTISAATVSRLLATDGLDAAIDVLEKATPRPRLADSVYLAKCRQANKEAYDLSPYPLTDSLDTRARRWLATGWPLLNEILYYRHTDFRDAWYIDNLGSFLIVIERTKP